MLVYEHGAYMVEMNIRLSRMCFVRSRLSSEGKIINSIIIASRLFQGLN